ncbi:hypothetical protein P3T36_007871 [Kitasatospora sp. MAP12-15]|uniref:hypothetical protein n=1 Tax=unclassified Kitasatospora TaxID=2633591 RepID=UPI002476B7EC|nr:hypothetical protein [Kitasatospora sp. MAP12-44]MDH6115555.1 hypothetical protein [Kitasatospora sp. MAP12-44]
MGGPGAEFAASNSHLYAISADHSEVDMWNTGQAWNNATNPNTWTKVGGPAAHLYAGRLDVARDRVRANAPVNDARRIHAQAPKR